MLEARSLAKYYNHTAAVRGVSFTILPGEILGYLGPKGAGKSTTVKMLTGLIEPSEGQIFYDGRSVHDDFPAYQRRVGYVPEEAHLYPHLTGYEYLQLVGRLLGMPRRALEPKIDEFLRLFSLWDDRHDPLSAYSKGMRQKVLLSAALLHNPDILILDEPFSGLDVTSAMVLRSLIHALAQQGKIILYSSHVLEVVEKVCSKVLILRKGEVVAYDSIGHLRDLMSQPSLEGVFAQLAETENSDELAGKILHVMTADAAAPPAPLKPPLERPAAAYFSGFWKDFRHALRTLAGSPGFTAVAVISLALGACIATCALSEMNGMLWREVPLASRPNELVSFQSPVSYPDYQRYRERTDLFSSSTAYIAPVPFTVDVTGRTERAWGQLVTPSYFPTLGVQPAAGRFFDSHYDQPGAPAAVVVSYPYWRNHLGSDPAVIGKTLRVNGHPATILGVAPAGFLGASPLLYPADLWLPVQSAVRLAPELAGNALERRDRQMFRVTGRLLPGATQARAEAELDAVARKIEDDFVEPGRNRPGRRVTLVEGGKLLPFRKQDKPVFTSFFLLIAALMALIPCTNVANMLLARAVTRRREIAVRLALGAGRARLIRQLLTESVILAAAAGALGFLGSMWLMRALSHVKMPFLSPVNYDFQPDLRVLLCALAMMVITGLAFGLAPALQATRTNLQSALKEGGALSIGRNRRLSARNLLIVSQVAGTLTLLTMLGFQSFGIQTTLGIQQGFDPGNLYLVSLDPVRDGFSGRQSEVLLRNVLDRVKLLPSISSAALTQSVPVSMPGASLQVLRPVGGSRAITSAFKHVVGHDYFATARVPILRGREFRREDETAGAAKVIVSEALVREFWPRVDPLGRTVQIGEAGTGAGGSADAPLHHQQLAGSSRIRPARL